MSPGLIFSAWLMLVTTLAGATTQPGQAGVPFSLRPGLSPPPTPLAAPLLPCLSSRQAGLPTSSSANFLPSQPGNSCRLLPAFRTKPGRPWRQSWPSSRWERNHTRLGSGSRPDSAMASPSLL